MTLATALTARFGLDHPIVSAPMGGVAGGRLAAAVSNAGGLGLVGGGYGEPSWLERELALVKSLSRPWGVGFITWSLRAEVLEMALDARPAVVMLSFGDPAPWAPRIRQRGSALMCQVQDLASAKAAAQAGADLIVAQGTEAGGHTGRRSTLALVPAVVDLVAPIPVLAAGGIADGRGLAAALTLGAAGALIGTRFYASEEALGHPLLKRALAAKTGDETTLTRLFDILRGYAWPKEYAGRAIENSFTRRWQDLEAQLSAAAEGHRPALEDAKAQGDFDNAMVWAGEAIDLIKSVAPAGELVRSIAEQAETTIHACRAASRARPRSSGVIDQRRRDRLFSVFARNVRAARLRLGLSEHELADRAQVHADYIGMIERCQTRVTLRKVERFAAALGVDPALLLMREVSSPKGSNEARPEPPNTTEQQHAT